MKIDDLFPHIKHSIEDFLFDEEGNIPRSKILAIGSMVLVLSIGYDTGTTGKILIICDSL